MSSPWLPGNLPLSCAGAAMISIASASTCRKTPPATSIGKLPLREFSREDERKLRIVFDNPLPGALDPILYERTVQLAASLGWHFHHEDVEVSYVAAGLEPTPDVFTFLHYLALVEPQEATSVFDRLRASQDYNLIVTTRDRSQLPPILASRSYVITLGAGASAGLAASSKG